MLPVIRIRNNFKKLKNHNSKFFKISVFFYKYLTLLNYLNLIYALNIGYIYCVFKLCNIVWILQKIFFINDFSFIRIEMCQFYLFKKKKKSDTKYIFLVKL